MSTVPNLTQDILTSIQLAIREYTVRNNRQPAKLLLSYDAYLNLKYMNNAEWSFSQVPTIFGIPFEISKDRGVHIYLCEPEIHIIQLSSYKKHTRRNDGT